MERTFDFYGNMPDAVLRSYLSRAVTHFALGYGNRTTTQTFEDDLRMLVHEGAKFIGRAAFIWDSSYEIGEHFRFCRERAELAHKADPQFILQACVFECVAKKQVESVPVPARVFEAFDLVPEERHFSFEAMLFPDGRWLDHWGPDTAIEDVTRLETRLWIYYLATAYIDAGYEALHFGQVVHMGGTDTGWRCWREVLTKIRAYAAAHSRRHYVLFDAHTLRDLRKDPMFDYNAFPIRPQDVPDGEKYECVLQEGMEDSLYNDDEGLFKPFIVELDNYDKMEDSELDKPHIDSWYNWGYDEITWFTKLSDERRRAFLRYARHWVNERYPDGWVQMPSRRCLVDRCETVWAQPDIEWLEKNAAQEAMTYTIDENGAARISRMIYSANRPSDACPFGLGDEDTIAELFAEDI